MFQEILGDLNFHSLFFAYPKGKRERKKMILRDFSVRIGCGKSLALVGPSGCGKSTCIQLLERFYDPMDGLVVSRKSRHRLVFELSGISYVLDVYCSRICQQRLRRFSSWTTRTSA